MQKIIVVPLLSLLCLCNELSASYRFEQKSVDDGKNVIIHLYKGAQPIGYVGYKKMPLLPLLPWYYIHSLYVYPENRRKGYGGILLLQILDEIKRQGGTRVYVQPGPFEMIDGHQVGVGALYEQEMKQLFLFYSKYGFTRSSKIMSILASIFYYFSDINEDSNYLMMKKLF